MPTYIQESKKKVRERQIFSAEQQSIANARNLPRKLRWDQQGSSSYRSATDSNAASSIQTEFRESIDNFQLP